MYELVFWQINFRNPEAKIQQRFMWKIFYIFIFWKIQEIHFKFSSKRSKGIQF